MFLASRNLAEREDAESHCEETNDKKGKHGMLGLRIKTILPREFCHTEVLLIVIAIATIWIVPVPNDLHETLLICIFGR